MKPKWMEEVSIENLVDGTSYFIAKRPDDERGQWFLNCRMKDGCKKWATKPGLAIPIVCSDFLREYLAMFDDIAAIAIPKDAGKRWKARQ